MKIVPASDNINHSAPADIEDAQRERKRAAIAARLADYESPERVQWLRRQMHHYCLDLAAYAYFRLPFYISGERRDPRLEAVELAFILGNRYELSAEEIDFSFHGEWHDCTTQAEELGERIKRAAFSAIKYQGGSAEAIERALIDMRNKLPPGFAYLLDDELHELAAGFTPSRRRGAP